MRATILLGIVLAIAATASAGFIRIGFLNNANQVDECGQKCENSFALHTTEKESNELNSCKLGCRLFSIIDSIDLDRHADDDDFAQAKKNCYTSCEKSFVDKEDETNSCKLGCDTQGPIAKERRENLAKTEDEALNEFGAGDEDDAPVGLFHAISMPRLRISFPSSDDFGFSGFPESGSISQMMNDMRSRMNSMMQRMMGQVENGMDMSSNGEGPIGQLTVIKSGPGYHEEKTYHFGGKVDKDDDEVEEMMNDELNKVNPLDEFFDDDDVEEFEPVDDGPNEVEKVRAKIENQLQHIFDHSSSSVHGYDSGPYMSSGLRPRHLAVCDQPSQNMKWSDWVSCLHLRMGMPRWLTAATISLGIVFIVWLCLVIPHNAPKQRVAGKKEGDAKAAEANQLEKKIPLEHGDMPPAYEDVANLYVATVAVPVHVVKKALDQDEKEEKNDEEKA